jgi:hypothetical protein
MSKLDEPFTQIINLTDINTSNSTTSNIHNNMQSSSTTGSSNTKNNFDESSFNNNSNNNNNQSYQHQNPYIIRNNDQTRLIKINRQLQEVKFCSNSISTSKYNAFTFVPKFLFEQFRKYSNIFFFMIVLLQVILLLRSRGIARYLT